MGTIEDMGVEIRFQIEDLLSYRDCLLARFPSRAEESGGRGCVFTGAGDSMAVALAAEYFSGFEAKALDPYEASLNPQFLQNKHLYVISVSGRTIANIDAAQLAKKHARRVTAITANPESRLARLCDDVIQLGFRKTGGLSPGTNSFTTSLLAALSRIGPLPSLLRVEDAYERAKAWAESATVEAGGTLFFVAAEGLYPLALYGAAKIHEVLGRKAQYERLEQFSHMELFSLSDADTVVLLLRGQEDDGGVKLEEVLRNLGVATHMLKVERGDYVNTCVDAAIHLQVLPWTLAVKDGIAECAFLVKRDALKASDQIIY